MSKFAVLATGVAAVVTTVLVVAPTGASAAAKKQLTIAADTRTMYYGGTEPSLSYTVYGLAAGDKLTKEPTCSVPAHRAVGKYAISCTGAKANTAKYTIAYVSAPLYVGKAPLYVAPDYQKKFYGEAEPPLTYSSLGLVGDDKFVTTPTCTIAGAHTDAGHYKITCSGADAGSNYDIVYRENLLDVAQRPLLVGPNKQAIYYGTPEPKFDYATYGLVQGEKLVTEPTCAVSGEHVHAGAYTITCTGTKATSNYSLNVVTNTYTVVGNKSVVKGDRAAITKNLLGQPTGASLRAQLYLVYPYGTVFPQQTLTFTAGAATLCTAVTDKDGYASCKLGSNVKDLVKNGSYTVTYAGAGKDGSDIAASSDTVKNG